MPSPDSLAGSVSDGLPADPRPAPAADRAGNATVRRSGVPEVPGVLTATEVLATAEHIAGRQEPGGAISWPDGHTDAWDHVECAMALSVCGLSGPARRAYDWLRHTQRADGSWPKRTEAGIVTDAAAESNQTAYVAVGTWHEFQLTGDTAFLAQMWPVVRRAIGFVLDLQLPRGEIVWQRTADGTPARYALLTGCSSTYQSLLCAARLARLAGEPQPRWERAARQLGHVVAGHPGAFADKSRFSMDWYYPVLAGPVRGPAARARLDSGWAEFVVPGLGVRCVRDEPWVTGAETCELVMALDAVGDSRPGPGGVRGGPAPAGHRRRLLDRLAVREPGALPGRAEQLDRGGDDPGRRRPVPDHPGLGAVPRPAVAAGPASLRARGGGRRDRRSRGR